MTKGVWKAHRHYDVKMLNMVNLGMKLLAMCTGTGILEREAEVRHTLVRKSRQQKNLRMDVVYLV
jgi:hypothetical protein